MSATNERDPKGEAQPLYHRRESPTQDPQTARMQEESGEIWGYPPKPGGQFARVKAYSGALPVGVRGVEFITPVRPDLNTPPGFAFWSEGA